MSCTIKLYVKVVEHGIRQEAMNAEN